ncbi:ABC transporter permease [Limimaricola cinnabarinus]|uniref:ABC transporter permease n=1 Tax=Limimaricola cinnabarinus TaxID=1125964 RepID=A0A2G1MHU5_9RHOB|nr:ABC transporter permease [Limimaricola cinnabarinus]PHP28264.1 ABC transporter permease [Limimaricola cinnabarinus]
MSIWLWIVTALAVIAALARAGLWAARRLSGDAPRFRDMSYGEALGYALALAAIIGGVWLWMKPGAVYFRWAVMGFAICAVAAYLFRLAGRHIGPAGLKRQFRRMPLTAAFGILVIILYAIVAIFAGWIAPHGQEAVLGAANIVPGGDPAMGGDPAFPLGTDRIGRDILSRLIYGAQNTVGLAFATTLLAFFLGGALGLLAAVVGGWLDQLLSRGVDVLMAIPSLIFALLLLTIASVWADGARGLMTLYMVLIIAVIDSTRVFRLARAVGIGIVVMDYVEAAKLRGEGMGHLVFREILPNAMAPLLAEFGLRFCFVFLTIASLSFLGVGIQPPLADWGTMVRDLAQFINFAAFAPMVALAPLLPALAIAVLTVGVNFVVDWMLHRSSGLKS